MNVLCVMAHPDDEVLGCGGTLAKHVEAGDEVLVHILGRQELVHEARAAAEVLGATVACDFLPDQRFETVPLGEFPPFAVDFPDVVYTHNPDDLNLDHALTARAVLTAFRAPSSQAAILACEVISSTEFGPAAFEPNHWEVLTGDQVVKKVRALSCYPSEVRTPPHPRNGDGVWNQVRYRGQQICQPYAEAFRVLRSIR